MTRGVWPEPKHLNQMAEFLDSLIDEGIVWKKLPLEEKKGIVTRKYSFERDSRKKVKHPEHYLKPYHLQIEFCPDYSMVTIDLVCLPDSERGKGIGTRLIKRLEEMALSLGYKALTLSSIPQSEAFWLKNGFQVLDEKMRRYPRAMVKILSPDLDPERILCWL